MFCRRRTSSSCAATLRRLRPRRDSVLSSPRRTRSMTSLSSATLWAYAWTAASGSSFVESSWTASRASSRARVRARRDDGRCSVEGGARCRLADSLDRSDMRDDGTKKAERGGGSDRSSGGSTTVRGLWSAGAEAVWRIWEKCATAARPAEGAREKDEGSWESGGRLGMGWEGGGPAGRYAADERRRWAMTDSDGGADDDACERSSHSPRVCSSCISTVTGQHTVGLHTFVISIPTTNSPHPPQSSQHKVTVSLGNIKPH